MKYTLYYNEKGQTLIEVIVAIVLSALILVGVVKLVASSFANVDFSENQVNASASAQQGIDYMGNMFETNYAQFINVLDNDNNHGVGSYNPYYSHYEDAPYTGTQVLIRSTEYCFPQTDNSLQSTAQCLPSTGSPIPNAGPSIPYTYVRTLTVEDGDRGNCSHHLLLLEMTLML